MVGEQNRLKELRARYDRKQRKRRRKGISQRVRQIILERDGHKCFHCGSTERLTLDHIIPFSKGGTNAQANLQVLCQPCNGKKANKL